MGLTDAVRNLGQMATSSVRKSAVENELLVIDWSASEALLLHVQLGHPPKIQRYSHLRFDTHMTDNDKRSAYNQFLSAIPAKDRPRMVLTWSDGVIFRQLTLPEMPPEDLVKALQWDLKKKYYFNADENLFGYHSVLDIEGDEAKEKLYNIFYSENKTVLPRLAFFTGLGVDIRSLFPSQAALARLASLEKSSPEKDIFICDMSESSAKLVIARNGAEMLFRNVALNLAEGVWTDDVLSRVSEEIHRTMDYYEGQRYSRPIEKLLFVGSSADGQHLIDFMSAKFTIPVKTLDLEGSVGPWFDEQDKNFILTHPGLIAKALGAAMVQDSTLDLLPEDIKSRNRLRQLHRGLNIGLALFALTLAVIAGLTYLNAEWTKANLKTLTSQYENVTAGKRVFEEILAKEKARRTALLGDVSVTSMLKELSVRTPTVIALRDVQYDRNATSLTLAGDVTDTKRDAKTVTQYASALSETAFFATSNVGNTGVDDETHMVRFEINNTTKGVSV